MITHRLYALALAGLLCGGAVMAQTADSSRDALMARATELSDSVTGGEIAATLDFMPPGLLAQLAVQANTDPAGLKEMMKQQVQEMAEGKDFSQAIYDIALDDAKITESSAGRAYVVTTAHSAFPGLGVPDVTTPMVALIEDEIWHFVRLETPMQGMMLGQIYPDLAQPIAAIGAN